MSIKDLGCEVVEAATGPEAIDKASSMRPNLIMMDVCLPGMKADEATLRLKRNLSTQNIPVIITTSSTTVCTVGDRANRALDAGAEEILYKPFHLTMWRHVLRTYLLALMSFCCLQSWSISPFVTDRLNPCNASES